MPLGRRAFRDYRGVAAGETHRIYRSVRWGGPWRCSSSTPGSTGATTRWPTAPASRCWHRAAPLAARMRPASTATWKVIVTWSRSAVPRAAGARTPGRAPTCSAWPPTRALASSGARRYPARRSPARCPQPGGPLRRGSPRRADPSPAPSRLAVSRDDRRPAGGDTGRPRPLDQLLGTQSLVAQGGPQLRRDRRSTPCS